MKDAADATSTATITNTPIYGNASVVKVDQTHYDAYNEHLSGVFTDVTIEGAEFYLTCVVNNVAVNVNVIKDSVSGHYILDRTDNVPKSNIVVSGSDGKIYFDNLPLNTYTLTEKGRVSGFLQRTTPSVFTVDVNQADSTEASASYDSGFIYASDIHNRIGNLQHVEQTQVSFVKSDKDDRSKKLANATYYLLKMVPYQGQPGFANKLDYIAAADKAIMDCNFEIRKDGSTELKDEVSQFWHTSDMVNGGHIPYIYATDQNGRLKAPLLMLAKPNGDVSMVYAIDNGSFSIPINDSGIDRFTISGLEASNGTQNYTFRITDVTDAAGTSIDQNDITFTQGSPDGGKVTVTVECVNASTRGLKFTLQRTPTSEGADDYENVPDFYEYGDITGLMDGRYTFIEVQAPEGYQRSYCDPFAFTIEGENRTYHVEHQDVRKNASLDIYKENEYGDPLEGAEFELYYQPDTAAVPPTYSINSPVTSPVPTISLTPYSIEIPTAALDETQTTSVQTAYIPPETVPNNEPESWVLPRTDNDYIFLEDVQMGYWFWKGGTIINESYDANGRKLTKGDLDNESSTIMARFYDKNGNSMGEFEVWERFVHYDPNGKTYNNDGNETGTAATSYIIWKIQPPDGAKKVKFYRAGNEDGNSTDVFEFTKGKLYRRGRNTGNSGHVELSTWSTNGANKSDIAYEPMAQKIIFRRNHVYCWDNIHIEFFEDADGYIPVGASFPGYMMEPYAYAQSNYRINFPDSVEHDGDLCYEIAIPKGAKYFRINNGTNTTHSSGKYAGFGKYMTKITPIDLNSTNKKNYNNYWKLSNPWSSLDSNGVLECDLIKWDDSEITLRNDTIYDSNGTAFEVDSDHDFIYFTKPSGWSKVYAYFYGGGDLRANNWQRACWSIWPGVLPFNSELNNDPTNQNGNNVFNTSIGNVILQPGATFKNKHGQTVYRFRRPVGDTKDYFMVMFNNGMVGYGSGAGTGGRETVSIEYTLGKGYYAKNENDPKTGVNEWTQEQSNKTITYAFRDSVANDNKPDYIYVKNTTGNTWDDIHIQFYNGNSRILQQASGYVMKYSGTKDGVQWFKVPVPQNATHFTLSNGYDKSGSYNYEKHTDKKYPILAYSSTEPTTSGYTTTGDMVYTINDAHSGTTYSLKLSSPVVTRIEVTSSESGQQFSDADYTVRGDKLHILDAANSWSLANPPSIKFYGAGDTQIGSSYHGIMSNGDAANDNKHWWSLDIPDGAESFTIGNGTTKHAIYPISSTPTGEAGSTFTNGGMYYKTTSATTADILWPSFINAAGPTGGDDGNYDKRGDYLYMVCNSIDVNGGWDNMYVTFYSDKEGTTPINNAVAVQMKYTGNLTAAPAGTMVSDGTTTDIPEAVGHWYKVAIPYEAKSFKVFNNTTESTSSRVLDKAYPIYTKRSTLARYRQNYTLGGMQYRISNTATSGKYTLGLAEPTPAYTNGLPFYPQFTENEVIEWEEGEGLPQTQTDPIVVDSSLTAMYADAGVVPAPESVASAPSDLPVLYQTANDDVSYTWTESNAYWFLRFVKPDDWGDNVYAHFYVFGTSGTHYAQWPGVQMTATSGTYQGETIYAVLIPKDEHGDYVYSGVVFNNGSDAKKTGDINLPDRNDTPGFTDYGFGYTYNYSGSTVGEVAPVSTTAPVATYDNKIYLTNDRSWTNVTAQFYNSSDSPLGSPVNMVTDSGNLLVSQTTVPTGAAKVIFSGLDGTDSVSTEKADVPSDTATKNYKYSIAYTPACDYINRIVYYGEYDSVNMKIYLWNDNSNSGWSGMNNSYSGPWGSDGWKYDIPSDKNYTHAIIENDSTNNTYQWCMHIDLTANNGRGEVYTRGSWITDTCPDHSGFKKFNPSLTSYTYDPTVSGTDGTYSASYSEMGNTLIPTTTTHSVTYQPEDRYGLISSNTNGVRDVTDTGNFLTVTDNASLTAPYIRFYSDAQGNTLIGSEPNGINLKDAKLNGTTPTDRGSGGYLVRLPKNAKSVRLYDDTTPVGSLVVLDNDGGAILTVTGTTGNYTVTKTSTEKRSTAIHRYELRSDFNYIYFTDTNSWTSTSDTGMLYAYYYGGAEGEYAAWPGVPAVGSYTDNNGNTVYEFIPPTTDGSRAKVYPYAIFNNGSAQARKITTAINYTMGMNYVPNSSPAVDYGTITNAYSTTGYLKAQGLSSDENTSNGDTSTVPLTLGNKYIFFVNNGTKDLRTSANSYTEGRYKLDEVHISFYNSSRAVIGNKAGYLMDQLMADYEGDSVYRISVPDEAVYFCITNGTGKEQADNTTNNYRTSELTEITQNGLYRFVRKADSKLGTSSQTYANANGLDEADISTITLSQPLYYLELLNKREDMEDEDVPIIFTGQGDPVYLATVETDKDGLTKQILRLKEKTEEGKTYNKDDDSTYIAGTVDNEYLDHDPEDIENTDVHVVRTKKWGNYFWKEVKAPTGYEADAEELETFRIEASEADREVYIVTATDSRHHGKVTLTKTAEEKLGTVDIGETLKDAEFSLYSSDDPHHPVELLKQTGSSSYLVPKLIAEKSVLSEDGKYLIVTDSTMLSELEGYDLYDSDPGHFKIYTTVTTDSLGTLTVDNLDWGQYYFIETKAPTGYVTTDTSTGEANKVRFSVGRNNCEIDQQLICTDEIKSAKLRIDKQLDQYLEAWGTPTFIFKIEKVATPESNTSYTRYISMQVDNKTEMKGTTGFFDIEPGTYTISEINVSRYSPKRVSLSDESSEGVTATITEDAKSITVNVDAEKQAVVKFENTIYYYDKFSHTDLEVNTFNGYKTIKVEYNDLVPVMNSDTHEPADNAEIEKKSLTAYFIKSDGTAVEMSQGQKESLTFTYVKQEKDDEGFEDDFTDDESGKKIVIAHPDNYADGVYRLKASYGGGISGILDISFDGRTAYKKLYGKTVIFHADENNLSYYADSVTEGERTTQYVFDFDIGKDKDNNPVILAIRHNGQPVTIDDVKAIINNTAPQGEKAPLRIIETHREYSFGSQWRYENGETVSTISSSALVDTIEGVVKTDDNKKVITYTAVLTNG